MKKKEFLKAVDTLKRYRRSDLVSDDGKEIVTSLYVDPLPEDHILNTVLKPNTTFLVGRKGTGKSTIFQRAQEELNSNSSATWAYIDIKSLYEASTSEVIATMPTSLNGALSVQSIERLNIFKSFLVALICEIKSQVQDRIKSSIWARVKAVFVGELSDLFEALDDFLDDIKENQYLDVTGVISSQQSDDSVEKFRGSTSGGVSLDLSSSPSMSIGALVEMVREVERSNSQNYSKVYLRVFNIRGLIDRLKEILERLNIRHIYVFVDDFSELL